MATEKGISSLLHDSFHNTTMTEMDFFLTPPITAHRVTISHEQCLFCSTMKMKIENDQQFWDEFGKKISNIRFQQYERLEDITRVPRLPGYFGVYHHGPFVLLYNPIHDLKYKGNVFRWNNRLDQATRRFLTGDPLYWEDVKEMAKYSLASSYYTSVI